MLDILFLTTTERVVQDVKGGGDGYHDPSAKDARRRIIAFFNKHLKT
jgi:hypothetical protein